jgi:hypothetical protein
MTRRSPGVGKLMAPLRKSTTPSAKVRVVEDKSVTEMSEAFMLVFIAIQQARIKTGFHGFRASGPSSFSRSLTCDL